MAQAVNQNNLVDIINSMAKESESIVNMVNNIISKLANIKTFDKKQLENVKSSVVFTCEYLEIISKVSKIIPNIKTFDKKQLENVKSSVVFIGDYLENISKIISNIKAIDDNSIDEKSINKIAGVVGSISKLFKDVSQIDINMKGIMNFKFKLNVIIPFILKSIATDLIKSLQNVNNNDKVKQVKSDFKEYIDNIGGLFDTINSLNDIKFPNLIKLQINLYVFNRYLPAIINSINNLFDENKQVLISKKRIDAVINTINNIKDISNEMSEINKILIKGIIINAIVLKLLETKNNPFDVLIAVVLKIYEFSDKLDKKLGNQQLNTQKLNDIKTYVDSLRDFTKNIKNLVLDIVVIGLLFPVLILAVPVAIASILLISGFLWSTTLILKLNPGVLLNKELNDLTRSILMLALSMATITITLVIIAMAGPIIMESVGQVALTFLVVVGALIAIAGLLFLASKATFSMAISGSGKLMLAVLVVCGSILAVAGTILLTSLIADSVISNIGPFMKMFGVTLLIIISAAALAFVASLIGGPILLGLAAVGLTVLGLMAVTLLISKLAKPEYNVSQHEEAIKTNVQSIKNIISTILSTLLDGGLLGDKNNNEGNRGLVGSIINFVSPSLYSLYEIIITFAFLFTTLLSVGALILIGNLLGRIATIELEPTIIQQKITDIVDCVNLLMNALTAKRDMPAGDRGFFGGLINWLSPGLANMVDAISSMFTLGISVISVGALTLIAKELNSIQNIVLDKNALVGEDGKSGKVAMIMNTADAVISAISGQESDVKKGTIKDAVKKVKRIEKVVKNLHDINEYLIKIYNENIPYEKGTLPGVINLISDTEFEKVIKNIADNKSLNRNTVQKSKYYKQILKNIYGKLPDFNISTEFAKNSIDVTDNYIKFIEKISATDVKKLETTVNMFEKMADFSKSINGNFEKLAESINEDLMPVLEELKETLNKIPEKIDTNAASVSQSISAYSAPAAGPTTPYGMTQQVQRENPGMSQQEVSKMVDSRLNEQARAQAQSLESKFDELIELLKSGMARVSLT